MHLKSSGEHRAANNAEESMEHFENGGGLHHGEHISDTSPQFSALGSHSVNVCLAEQEDDVRPAGGRRQIVENQIRRLHCGGVFRVSVFFLGERKNFNLTS
jgi:hypothetical protein